MNENGCIGKIVNEDIIGIHFSENNCDYEIAHVIALRNTILDKQIFNKMNRDDDYRREVNQQTLITDLIDGQKIKVWEINDDENRVKAIVIVKDQLRFGYFFYQLRGGFVTISKIRN